MCFAAKITNADIGYKRILRVKKVIGVRAAKLYTHTHSHSKLFILLCLQKHEHHSFGRMFDGSITTTTTISSESESYDI